MNEMRQMLQEMRKQLENMDKDRMYDLYVWHNEIYWVIAVFGDTHVHLVNPSVVRKASDGEYLVQRLDSNREAFLPYSGPFETLKVYR